MLKTEYLRDGRNQILGTTTSGFADGTTLARDRDNCILGRSSDRFENTRDGDGRLVSRNSADVGLLFRR
jgi:hypothetical protein